MNSVELLRKYADLLTEEVNLSEPGMGVFGHILDVGYETPFAKSLAQALKIPDGWKLTQLGPNLYAAYAHGDRLQFYTNPNDFQADEMDDNEEEWPEDEEDTPSPPPPPVQKAAPVSAPQYNPRDRFMASPGERAKQSRISRSQFPDSFGGDASNYRR